MKLEPYHYIPLSQCLPVVIQKQLDFIYEIGSLTYKLRQKTSYVSIKCEHYQFGSSYIRDVMIIAQKNLQWCARTTIPKNTLAHFNALFPVHQKNAIGDFLFAHPSMKRVSLEFSLVSKLPHGMTRHFGLCAARNLYWFRTSKWYFEQEYFLEILEIF